MSAEGRTVYKRAVSNRSFIYWIFQHIFVFSIFVEVGSLHHSRSNLFYSCLCARDAFRKTVETWTPPSWNFSILVKLVLLFFCVHRFHSPLLAQLLQRMAYSFPLSTSSSSICVRARAVMSFIMNNRPIAPLFIPYVGNLDLIPPYR